MKGLPALDRLTAALKRLPGVGPRSAQRHAFHLLQHDREGAEQLGRALADALARCAAFYRTHRALPVVCHCEKCLNGCARWSAGSCRASVLAGWNSHARAWK